MSRNLWGDRINNLFFKGDRYYCESLVMAIAITVSRDLWAIALTIYFLKAIAIIVSRDYGAISLIIYFLKAIAMHQQSIS